jgi:hypothetical protein
VKLKDLVQLQDLARSRGIMAKGKRDVRNLKKPASCQPCQKKMVRMNGLGHADPRMLVREAEAACRLLMKAEKEKASLKLFNAVEDYFKASAIATNVLFTMRVEKIQLPSGITRDMDTVVSKSADSIKAMAKSVAFKALKKKVFGRKKGK